MKSFAMTRRAILAGAVAIAGLGQGALADGQQLVDSIHFLIPGGAGGGWDGTARGTGEALTEAGLVGSASYENMSGGGGGKAIGFLIENADSSHNTLMVNSTRPTWKPSVVLQTASWRQPGSEPSDKQPGAVVPGAAGNHWMATFWLACSYLSIVHQASCIISR